MRRLLACVIAVELLAAGLALAAFSDSSRRSKPFDASRVPSSAERAAASGADSLPARAARFVTELFGAASSSSDSTAETHAAGPTETVSGRPSLPGGQISFREPVDFQTGAIPPSAGHNAIDGDQSLSLPTKATLSDSLAVGDFNHDGKPDVAQTNVVAGSVSILLGDGRAGFTVPNVPYPVGEHPQSVVAGHLDRDRHLDLAVANTGSGDVAVLLGVGDGAFRSASFVPVPAARNVAIGDFTGDDIPDLAVASGGPGAPGLVPAGGVAILTGNGNGSFVPAQFIRHTHSDSNNPVGANFVAVGDFNGGGFDDIAVAVGNNRSAGDRIDGSPKLTGDDVLIYLNRNETLGAAPDGPFGPAPDQPALRVGGAPDAIAVAHFNGDNHLDLVVMASASGDITTLFGDSRGRFAVGANNVTASGQARALAIGDFNDDGIRDVATANWHGSTVSVLQGNGNGEGNGDGTFQAAVDFWSGDATSGVAVGHFDGDQRLDIVAARLQHDELALLRNDSLQPGDGVAVTRDIPYGSPTHATDDPYAAHHVLDVYTPPRGTPSLDGSSRPYPVALFVHGGAGVSGDKAMATYLMRSWASAGIVVISADYRLGTRPPAPIEDQLKDVQQAFRWARDHVGSRAYGGDPDRIVVFGHSWGALLAGRFGTESNKWPEQRHIRGLVLVSFGSNQDVSLTPTQPASLLVTGTEGSENANRAQSAVFARRSQALGTKSEHVAVSGRDHLTVLANLARPGDPGREAMLRFIRDT